MNREQLELVTAYVDGEATADERARVEADAELLAEVELQRAARAELHDVDPPSAAARESAIAAALAVFDDEVADTIRPAAQDVTAPTNIVPFEQRRRMRWMQSVGAAAAVTAVVVAGAVIATRGGGDNGSTADQARDDTELSVVGSSPDQDAAAQPPAAAEVATSDASVLMAVEPTDEAPGEAASAADAANAADAEAPGTGSVSEYEDDVATGGAPPAAPATSIVTAPAAPAPASAATARMVIVINDDDLRELADTLKAPPLDVGDAETECADATLKAEAMFDDDDDGDQHPIVVVAIDDDTLGALTLDDCEVVLEADLDPGP